VAKENEVLSKNLRLEQESHLRTQQLHNALVLSETQCRQKLLAAEKQHRAQNQSSSEEIVSLRQQLAVLREQFEHLTDEHSQAMKQIGQHTHDEQERQQHLQDEVQRLKRDLGLELYRKQDAEKKARAFEDKLRHEQTEYQKIQYDFTKTKHDLKTLQVKYDALQLEMIDIHQKTKSKPPDVVQIFVDRTSTTTANDEQLAIESPKRTTRSKRRTEDEVSCEHRENRSKSRWV
jgi:chromosome segregation ATPase